MPSFEVEIPSESADRPGFGKIAAWALGGLTLGLLLAYGSLDAQPPEGSAASTQAQNAQAQSAQVRSEGEAEQDTPAEEEAEQDAAPEDVAEEDTAEEDTAPEEGAEEDTAAEEVAEQDTAIEEVAEQDTAAEEAEGEAEASSEGGGDRGGEAAAPIPISELSVRRGRVAYLRCAGVERRGQRFPCPRDEALEGAVWPLIEGLLSCADPPGAPGRADVRLDIQGNLAPVIDFRDRFSSADVRLDPERTIACLREPMAAVRQQVGAERLTVSFRFDVVRR